MKQHNQKLVPACVYVLADNLDAALAAGEDLRAVAQHWPCGDPDDPSVMGMRRWVLGRVRVHELSLISRILQARSNAEELAQQQSHFKLLAHLFVSSLNDFEATAQEDRENRPVGLEADLDMVEFLRLRGVVEKDAAGELPYETLKITDSFLIAGRIPLGLTLDLIAEVFDALETQFDLYPDDEEQQGETAQINLHVGLSLEEARPDTEPDRSAPNR